MQDVLDGAGDDAGVVAGELAALEGGGGVGEAGELTGEHDPGVSRAGADLEGMAEPGGGGQGHGGLGPACSAERSSAPMAPVTAASRRFCSVKATRRRIGCLAFKES